MKKSNYSEIADLIMKNVGDAENVTWVSHCMTRLRLTVKDKNLVNVKEIEQIEKVVGTAWSRGQFQIIIGNDVRNVYNEFIKMGNFELGTPSNEDLDTPKDKLTIKKIANDILGYVSGSVVGVIPVLTAAGLAITLNVLFGPSILNLYSDTSNIHKFINFIYEAGMYFFPVYLGYCAAKKLEIDPNYGIMMGCILITPSLLDIVNAGEPFTLFGFKMTLVNYSQSMLPVLLCVALLSVVNKFLSKHIPVVLSSILVPLLTMLITLPFALFLLAPLGTILGGYIVIAINWLTTNFSMVGPAIIASIWVLLIMTGMQSVVGFAYIPAFLETGIDYMLFPACIAFTTATWGIGLAAALALKDKRDKSQAFGFFTTNILGGITEPTVFGLILKYKKLIACQMIGAFFGGLYMGLTKVATYTLVGSWNFTLFIQLLGGGNANFVNGLIGGVIAMAVAFVLTYMWGIKNNRGKEIG